MSDKYADHDAAHERDMQREVEEAIELRELSESEKDANTIGDLFPLDYNDGPSYVVQNMEGHEVAGPWWSLAEAITGARAELEDDPELRELTVWEVHPSGNLVTHVKTIAFGPDQNWDTVIVELDPGEHARAPGPVPRQITEEDLEAYEPGDPKRTTLERHLGEWI